MKNRGFFTHQEHPGWSGLASTASGISSQDTDGLGTQTHFCFLGEHQVFDGLMKPLVRGVPGLQVENNPSSHVSAPKIQVFRVSMNHPCGVVYMDALGWIVWATGGFR